MRAGVRRWSAEEDSILQREAVAGRSAIEIARKVGRTESAVRGRAYVLRVSLPSSWRRGSIGRGQD